METAYREWEKRRQSRQPVRRPAERHKTGGKTALGLRERRRLLQLVVCAALFLLVFIGKGVFPDKMTDMRDKVLGIIQADTDFRSAFASLGASISAGEPVADTLGTLWVDVFGGGTVTVGHSTSLERAPLYEAEKRYFNPVVEPEAIGVVYRHAGIAEPAPKVIKPEPMPPPSTETIAPEPAPLPAPAPEVEQMAYNGPALPENTSMDKYRLDLGDTATPVLGRVSSGFGWREHPVDGGEKFHNGVDLAVSDGTDIGAFADGVVDYIGESPIYGLYFQIRHAGGITTFYAHCSKLNVQQGQTVKAGEKVAESGETGNVTGPHLHLEMKRNGVRINPLYYIKTQ